MEPDGCILFKLGGNLTELATPERFVCESVGMSLDIPYIALFVFCLFPFWALMPGLRVDVLCTRWWRIPYVSIFTGLFDPSLTTEVSYPPIIKVETPVAYFLTATCLD